MTLYDCLELSESATQDEIKAKYRELAKRYHPDQNRDNKDAEDKFKEISNAYDTLGNPEKRKTYDQERQYAKFNTYDSHFSNGGPINIDDIFNQIFSQHRQPSRNRDFNFNLTINLQDAFNGQEVPIQFSAPGTGKEVNLNVKIPPGIDSGARMRFTGYGDTSIPNVPPGDLYVTINVNEHHEFKRNGPHLMREVKISAIDCMLGTEYSVSCLDGSIINVKIPSGSQHGTMLRIKSKGMPTHNNQYGDLIIVLNVNIPHLNEIQKELCIKLQAAMVNK